MSPFQSQGRRYPYVAVTRAVPESVPDNGINQVLGDFRNAKREAMRLGMSRWDHRVFHGHGHGHGSGQARLVKEYVAMR